tara:strand:+ start:40 stop:420 length:381 start_codon:yes stop_codon:yes gene_type:complete
MDKLITITQLSTMLNLINKKTKKPSNHILRFWEKKFKQIRPTQLNNRRYYTNEQVEIIKLIKYLLKDKGFTINGVKKILNNNVNSLDDYNSIKLKTDYQKENIKLKSKKLLEKLKRLKRYGKKNTH